MRRVPTRRVPVAGPAAVQALLDYGARIGVALVVTPLLVHGLGSAVFGIWQMLSQLVSYISAADGRPTDALRLVIAILRGEASVPLDGVTGRITLGPGNVFQRTLTPAEVDSGKVVAVKAGKASSTVLFAVPPGKPLGKFDLEITAKDAATGKEIGKGKIPFMLVPPGVGGC